MFLGSHDFRTRHCAAQAQNRMQNRTAADCWINILRLKTQTSTRSCLIESTLHSLLVHSLSIWIWRVGSPAGDITKGSYSATHFSPCFHCQSSPNGTDGQQPAQESPPTVEVTPPDGQPEDYGVTDSQTDGESPASFHPSMTFEEL